jgi:CDP-diacylglycerol--glycerol-3-phosphate 3-phosphatidyltransferase
MNLANKITIFRMIMVPVFLLVVSLDFKYGIYLAIAIFIIAAFSDTLDGYIARSRNQVTNFGKFMDPLADKLIVISALVYLVEAGSIPGWVVMIIIARELAVTGLRTLAASEGIVLAAGPWGKAKTVTQMIAIVAALLNETSLNLSFYRILIALAVVLTIISGVDYFVKNKHVLKIK